MMSPLRTSDQQQRLEEAEAATNTRIQHVLAGCPVQDSYIALVAARIETGEAFDADTLLKLWTWMLAAAPERK
jgi:hypothetical protein